MSAILISLACGVVLGLLLIAVDRMYQRRTRLREKARKAPLRTWLGR